MIMFIFNQRICIYHNTIIVRMQNTYMYSHKRKQKINLSEECLFCYVCTFVMIAQVKQHVDLQCASKYMYTMVTLINAINQTNESLILEYQKGH